VLCLFRFPDPETRQPGIKESLLSAALTHFFELREIDGLKKKPFTDERFSFTFIRMYGSVDDIIHTPESQRWWGRSLSTKYMYICAAKKIK
jgi:hypothetical protein